MNPVQLYAVRPETTLIRQVMQQRRTMAMIHPLWPAPLATKHSGSNDTSCARREYRRGRAWRRRGECLVSDERLPHEKTVGQSSYDAPLSCLRVCSFRVTSSSSPQPSLQNPLTFGVSTPTESFRLLLTASNMFPAISLTPKRPHCQGLVLHRAHGGKSSVDTKFLGATFRRQLRLGLDRKPYIWRSPAGLCHEQSDHNS